MATPSNIQNIQLLDYNANPITPITYLDSITDQQGESTLTGKAVFDTWLASIESPSFTGNPTAPTAATTANNNQLATTQFVRNALSQYSIGKTEYATTEKFGIVKIGSGINLNNGVISVTPGSIPIASTSVLGAIKVGNNLSVTADGTLSANATPIQQATENVLGGVKASSRNAATDTVEVKIDSASGKLYTPATSVVIPAATGSTIGGILSGPYISVNTNGAATVNAIKSQDSNSRAYKIWKGTLAEYNAIATKDNLTIYYVDEN